MANIENKVFDIANAKHRELSVAYGRMRLSIRDASIHKDAPEKLAINLIRLTKKVKNGKGVLLEIAESSRDISMQKEVVIKEKQLANVR